MTVDHVTYLDPHDFNQGLGFDYTQRLFELGPNGYGAVTWSNVTFTDVYYQTRSGFAGVPLTATIPGGRPIPGAYNRWLQPIELPGRAAPRTTTAGCGTASTSPRCSAPAILP